MAPTAVLELLTELERRLVLVTERAREAAEHSRQALAQALEMQQDINRIRSRIVSTSDTQLQLMQRTNKGK